VSDWFQLISAKKQNTAGPQLCIFLKEYNMHVN
jgi:hypothetical protein